MEDNYNKLIKYTQGKLSSVSKKDFEEQLESNSEQKEEASFLKDLAQVSNWKGLMEEAQEELEEEAESKNIIALPSVQKEAKIHSIGLRRILAYAASISILIMALGFFHANNNYSNAALAVANTEKLGLQEDNSFRSDSPVKDAFQKGLNALDNKDFVGAADFFENISQSAEDYLPARLFLALAQFEQKDYAAAAANSQIVAAQSQNAITRHRAEWLQVQAYLATGKETEVLLNKIAIDDTHTFQKSAMELKKKVGSFWRRMVF